MRHITQEEIRQLFYHRDDGYLITIIRRGKFQAGHIAGGIMRNGYRSVAIGKKRYYAHRLAWIYHNGEIPAKMLIDHINGQKDDNRIANLRLAVHSQNNINSKLHRHNTSGYRGVWYRPDRQYWCAEIHAYGRKVYLGSFPTAEEAALAYQRAADEFFSGFRRAA